MHPGQMHNALGVSEAISHTANARFSLFLDFNLLEHRCSFDFCSVRYSCGMQMSEGDEMDMGGSIRSGSEVNSRPHPNRGT